MEASSKYGKRKKKRKCTKVADVKTKSEKKVKRKKERKKERDVQSVVCTNDTNTNAYKPCLCTLEVCVRVCQKCGG